MKSYLTDDEVRILIYEDKLEPVILNYVPFACYLADRVARNSATHERNDIRGVAILAMVEGVHLLKGHPNPRAFLRLKIKGSILNYVERSHTIHRPCNTERLTQYEYKEDVSEENQTLPKEFWSTPDNTQEIADRLMNSVILAPLEKEIVKLRIDGYTIEEIAVKCKLPWVQVQRTLSATRSRVDKILKGDY